MPSDIIDVTPNQELDPSDPYHLLPDWMKAQVDALSWESTELEDLEEKALSSTPLPKATAKRLKSAFWREYDSAKDQKRPILSLSQVIRGTMTQGIFKRFIHNNPFFLAWLMRPLEDPKAKIDHLHKRSLDELEKILELDAMTAKGPDSRLLSLKVRIYELLDQRLNGAYLQTIEQKNLNMNVNQSLPADTSQTSIEALDARIKELRKKAELLSAPPPIQMDVKALVQPNQVEENAGE